MASTCFCNAKNPCKNKSSNCLNNGESTPPNKSIYSVVNLKGALSKLILKPGDSIQRERERER